MVQSKRIWQTFRAGILLFAVSTVDVSSQFHEPTQSMRGEVSGTIADINGAVVAGAKVIFESEQGTRETNSIEDGSYTISLPVGVYRTTVTAKWFCSVVRPAFRVQPSASLRFDFVLVACPIVDSIITKDGQYNGETDRPKPPFKEEVIRLKSGLDLLIRFGAREEKRIGGLVHYRATRIDNAGDLPATAMSDLLTISADSITLDRKRCRLIAEGHVAIDDSKKRVYAMRAEIEFKKSPVVKLFGS